MTQDEIIAMLRASCDKDKVDPEQNGFWVIHTNELEAFAKLVAQHERDRIYAEELELPEPRLTGKFSLTAGLFKCTGCTGTWINRKTAQQHSCKDYQ
jgi:hypothetical protein